MEFRMMPTDFVPGDLTNSIQSMWNQVPNSNRDRIPCPDPTCYVELCVEAVDRNIVLTSS